MFPSHDHPGGGWSHVSQNYDLGNVLATIRDIGLSGHFVSGDSGVLTFTPASGETQTHVDRDWETYITYSRKNIS